VSAARTLKVCEEARRFVSPSYDIFIGATAEVRGWRIGPPAEAPDVYLVLECVDRAERVVMVAVNR